MKTRKYNYIGKDISNIKKELISNSFGYYKEDGTPVPYWKTPDEYVDEYGFDRTVVDSDGVYCRTVDPISRKRLNITNTGSSQTE